VFHALNVALNEPTVMTPLDPDIFILR
jgi:hypothetical protein